MAIKIRFGNLSFSERKVAVLFCSVAILLAQISDNMNSIAFMVISYILVSAVSLICTPECLFGMNLFLLADNNILDLGGISIQLLIMLIYILRFIFFRKRTPFFKTILSGTVISLYSFLYVSLGIVYALQGLKLALMIVYLTEFLSDTYALTREEYENYLAYAVEGLLISVVAAVIVNPSMLLSARIALSSDSNWNLLGILAGLLFVHSFVMCFDQRKRGSVYVVYSILTAACALISTSRTALLVCAIGIVWVIFFINKKRTLLRKLLIIFAICVFLVLLIQGVIQISYVDKLVDRIINPRRGDISNGRFVLWSGYIDYLLAHKSVLLLGYGKTLIEGITSGTSVASKMAHNIVIEQFTMYGILGTAVVYTLYRTSVWHIILSAKKEVRFQFKWKYAITIILVFVAGMFSHIITSVLVTMELYFGLIQYIALSRAETQTGSDGDRL